MRVSLLNMSVSERDAVGQCVLNQARFFRRRGDDVRIYTEHPPNDVPKGILDLSRSVGLRDLISGYDEYFTTSDLHVFHYPQWYDLVESMKGIERGAVLFYFHNVTPPDLWGSDCVRDEILASVDAVGSLVHYADMVVACSPFSIEQLKEYGVDGDRLRLLPNAVSLEKFSPGVRSEELLEAYDLAGHKVLLFVGRVAGNKRVDLLVEALRLVQEVEPTTKLLLVGDSQGNQALVENTASIMARAEQLGLADDVVFTGPVDDIAAHYRLADVYVTASLHEGFGIPLIEAMASGVPVVASRATAHPWVVDDAGLLAEPESAEDLAEKIVSILTDDGLCGELVRRGLERAREFSLERYEDRWAKIVADTTAWLPDQPYPRMRSLAAQPVVDQTEDVDGGDEAFTKLQELLLAGELRELEDVHADVMLRGYTVRSHVPLIGPLIAWVRRNLTSHLRGPYIDPTFERQVGFNRRVACLMQELSNEATARIYAMQQCVEQLADERQDLLTRVGQLEMRLSMMETRLALIEAEKSEAKE